MRVLIGHEQSGKTREEFRKRGHDAWSCDLMPSAIPGNHYQCDVLEVLDYGWDLAIFHPDCTYLTNSAAWAYKDGPYHQRVKPETLVGAARREARERALEHVRILLNAPIDKIALENPVGVISTRIRPASQYIQPYEYGEDASKKTGLWLKNLPLLRPTKYIEPRYVDGKPRWGNQTNSGQNKLSPSDDRWILRSETYQGWAEAFASQWG